MLSVTVARNLWLDSWERMNRGIFIHAGMEAGFLGEDIDAHIIAALRTDGGPLSPEQDALLPGMRSDSAAVARAALAWLPVTDWEPLIHENAPMVEAAIKLPLAGWDNFVGYADLVARHRPTGRVLVLDYKSRERFEDADADRFNKQFSLYLHGLRNMGIHCHGSLIFELKPTPPRRAPSVNHIDVGGIDSERLSSDGRFRTIPTYRSETFVNGVWADFEREAQVMATVRDEDIYRNMNAFVCKDCPYQKLCMAELNGEDTDYIMKTNYQSALRIVMEPV